MERRDEAVEVLRSHWDGRAAAFDSEAEHGLRNEEQRRAWLDLLAPIAGEPPKRVLDIGCGTGFLAMRFAELGHTVTGVDFAAQMLAVARKKAQEAGLAIDFRVDDAMNLSDADGTYDVAIARHVIWTMPDPQAAVSSWLRVLRPGGKLAIVEGKWADNAALARANKGTLRVLYNRFFESALNTLAVLRGRKQSSTVYTRRYRRIQADLPFSGGPSQEVLEDLLKAHGARNVVTTPMMDARYWGEAPRFPRYIVVAER